MSVITAAVLNNVIDDLCAWWATILGTSASGLGIGTSTGGYGAYDKGDDLQGHIAASGDTQVILDLGRNALALREASTAARVAYLLQNGVLDALDRHIKRNCGISGVTTLDQFLTYLNCTHATKWQALQHSSFRDLYNAIKGGTNYPSLNNLYFEVLQGATYANALRKHVVGSGNTAGFDIDQTKYCGGFPKLNVVSRTGSDVVTVTGTEYNPATKTFTAGKTWTVTVSGTGQMSFTGGTHSTDALIAAVSLISAGASLTASTMYVEALRPTGRPL